MYHIVDNFANYIGSGLSRVHPVFIIFSFLKGADEDFVMPVG